MRHVLEHIRWYWLEYIVGALVLAALVAVAPRAMHLKPSGYVDSQQPAYPVAMALPAQPTPITTSPITPPITPHPITPTPAATAAQPTSTVTVRVTVTAAPSSVGDAEDGG